MNKSNWPCKPPVKLLSQKSCAMTLLPFSTWSLRHSRPIVCAIVENAQMSKLSRCHSYMKWQEHGQLDCVNPLFELLEIEKSCGDCVTIEDPAFERVHGLSYMQWSAMHNPKLESSCRSQRLTRRPDKGSLNLTKTGTGVPTSRAMKTRSTVPYCEHLKLAKAPQANR